MKLFFVCSYDFLSNTDKDTDIDKKARAEKSVRDEKIRVTTLIRSRILRSLTVENNRAAVTGDPVDI
ncbi:hypothetical protein SDC9_92170 [bioreactor metagenome]|uniref:Uncharacterized protein n=1 Tax=bioreactor metagenome TaxID=1076179 RepID=A0A645A3Q1_9ZZZZ